ncbi:hypothetical protein FSARC_3842 [Fusarium sarcochroum]|uniref:Large ribosomal subunit protein mL50 n=1 Tax=Fusarium sarcochroum TaxID=1208366 RepID=A0A8H4U3G8_9HYPO|nr:hypothetical protein FSARC_3842 [Fusarium sarcochroum]
MPRIPRVGGLASLPSAIASVNRTSFVARATFSTSSPVHEVGKTSQWVRKQLWRGDAPGPEDPYNQRMEPEDTSNLPEEAQLSRADLIPYALRTSRLVLPPGRSEAMTEKEIESVDSSYAPATTMDDLEMIEPLKSWWEQPGHWGEESEFRGFAVNRVKDEALLRVYMRQAVAEAFSLGEAGLKDLGVKKWPVIDRAQLDRTLAVDIRVKDGSVALTGSHSDVAEWLKSSPQEPVEAAEISVEEAQQIVQTWDDSWKAISLDDNLKFAIRKRFYQLTGHLVPDVKLAAARTTGDLLTVTLTPTTRGKKLAEVLEDQKTLPSLPNVKVHSKRVTPIDREVSVGRWKVIEEELRKRDLPVTGTGGLGKNKERDWLTGKA